MLSSAWRARRAKEAEEATIWELLEEHGPRLGVPVVALANQKGGVGKTTSVVNLGAALALRGRRVLVVDCDPQTNATTGLGLSPGASGATTYEVIGGRLRAADAARSTKVAGLDCVAGARDLAGAELELAAQPQRESRLSWGLEGVTGYDLVLVDCPPSLGLLTVNALVAATDVIVPVQCEYYALEGLGQLLESADRVRSAFRPDLRVSGFLLTMYDARTKLSEQVADEVRGHFGALVFRCVVPRSVRLSEAPSFGEPVVTLDPGARGAIAYQVLAAEVEQRYGLDGAGVTDRESTRPARVARSPSRSGPGGRGYGTVTPVPGGLEQAFPRPLAWDSGR